jgi:protein-tyrosine-phosphatase
LSLQKKIPDMPSVLFVCTANRFRSPIAAAAFSRLLNKSGKADQWTVSSAGTWTTTGLPPIPSAVTAAAAIGLDIKGSKSRLVDLRMLEKSDLILVMESGQKEAIVNEFPSMKKKTFLLAKVAVGQEYDIPDPFGVSRIDADVNEIAGEINDLIEKGYKKIRARAHKLGA